MSLYHPNSSMHGLLPFRAFSLMKGALERGHSGSASHLCQTISPNRISWAARLEAVNFQGGLSDNEAAGAAAERGRLVGIAGASGRLCQKDDR